MKKEMSEERKSKLAYIWAVICLACSILIMALILGRSDMILPVFMGAVTILYLSLIHISHGKPYRDNCYEICNNDKPIKCRPYFRKINRHITPLFLRNYSLLCISTPAHARFQRQIHLNTHISYWGIVLCR